MRGYVTEADAAEFARRIPSADVVTLAGGQRVLVDATVRHSRAARIAEEAKRLRYGLFDALVAA